MVDIDLPFATLKYQDCIMYLKVKEGAVLGPPEINKLINDCENLSGCKPYLLLSDARAQLDISNEGRAVAAKRSKVSLIAANAVLVNNLGVRLVANVFSRINKPPFPFRVFNDEIKALKWLTEYKSKL